MPILQRDDGVSFVLRSYRETLITKKASLLRKELFLMSQAHGHYARFIKQPSKKIEAIFSQENGYLLGETVWQYFNRPANLLYCEALKEKEEAILVVVRDGNVYLDTKLSFSELKDELESAFSVPVKYAIYTSGAVPLSRKKRKDTVEAKAEHVQSFEESEASILNSLPLLTTSLLFPFEQAINELELEKPLINVLKIAGLCAILLFTWYWLTLLKKEPEQPLPGQTPYELYSIALTNADAGDSLNELARQVLLLETLPGWLPVSIIYNAGVSKVKVHTLGSPTELLLKWAQNNKGQVDFSSAGAALLLFSQIGNREEIPAISSSTKLLSVIIDRMMQIIPGKSVTIGASQIFSGYKSTQVTITLAQGSPIVLTLIARVLRSLPVILENSSLTIKDGLLSGTIQLTVLGN